MRLKRTIAVILFWLLLHDLPLIIIETSLLEITSQTFNLPFLAIHSTLNNDAFASELTTKNIPNKQKQLENQIIVFTRKQKGIINKKIFGNNLSGYTLPSERSGTGREWFGHSNYGTGIWNPKLKKTNKEVINLAKNAGISIVRFPGGHYSDYYNWKEAISKRSTNYLFGIDEFLKTCKEIDAEVVYTVNYLTGNERDAADLVEYLNSPNDGNNPNGGVDWAAVRSSNGHPEPYNVKYFEIGNEVYDKVSSTSYANGYIKFYDKMKEVEPTIMIGPVLHYFDYWNKSTMNIIKGKIDFGVVHTYSTVDGGYKVLKEKESAHLNTKEIFEKTLSLPQIRYDWQLKTALNNMELAAHKSIPLAITEFNSLFIQDKPVPYRHSLGNALVISEFLHIFLKPKNNILMANYWGYCNGYFGMIKSNIDFTKQSYKTPLWYIKRPNYYVYQLYNKYFGDILLSHELKSTSYDISKYNMFLETIVSLFQIGKGTNQNLLDNKWKIFSFKGVETLQKNGVLEITFRNLEKFNYLHSKKPAKVSPNTYYKLSGYIKTVNLVDKDGVFLAVHAKDLHGKHTQKIKGTTDWTYCETVFKTLLNTENVTIVVRRLGKEGPLTGKAFFKDLKLEEYIPLINTDIPYLTVDASKSSDNNTVYLMVINKNLEQDVETEIIFNNFTPSDKAKIYTLWGDNISSSNEKHPYNNVIIQENERMLTGNVLKTSFKKHSLTAIEIDGIFE